MHFFTIATVLFAVVTSVFASPVSQRDSTQSVAVILTDLGNDIRSLVDELLYATSENATTANLESIVNEISTSVTNAIDDLALLSGESTSVILASVDGTETLDASDIADLLGAIINLIFQAIEAVVQVVDPEAYTTVFDLLTALAKIIFSLISVLLPLVTGLVIPLLQIIASILPVVSTLDLIGLLSSILGVV